jgi:thioredoxin-related protein
VPRSALLTLFLYCAIPGVAWSQSASEPAEGVNWLAFEDGLQAAGETDRPVLVDIYAPWCGWCSRLQTDVYAEPDVQAYLANHFTVSRLNIDSIDDVVSFRGYELTSAELAMGLGASGTPTTVFLDASGDYITRLPGFVGAEEFLQILTFIGSKAYVSESFESFVETN